MQNLPLSNHTHNQIHTNTSIELTAYLMSDWYFLEFPQNHTGRGLSTAFKIHEYY